ncbi:MAG: response regulator [Chitinophagaceae bacterium]|nr:response regulator [Chitinophagaceae bacterium]MCW5904520.1 response regulator [Chitinophagaceae bacterium]
MNLSLLNNKYFLIVEDNAINQMLVKHAIAQFNALADIAETGTQALELMKTKQYDIILMDIYMPELDGYQTTEIIRNELKSNIPIIAMTALTIKGEEDKCLALGMNGYIPKPFNADILYNTLLKVLVPSEELV